MSKKEQLRNAAIAGGTSEVVQRYGSAAKEHLVGYSGVDNELGKELKRSLKSVAESKVNPKYQKQNLQQQAGFSAEVKETANVNAENIIKGKSSRLTRYDDIGETNHQFYDHVEIDAFGNIIDGTGTQMKFIGSSSEECWKKVTSSKCKKYVDNDVPITVPRDYYDKMIETADKEIASLEEQLKHCKGKQAESIKRKIEHCKKAKKNLRKSTVSSDEAMFARKHPKLSTAKDIGKIAHHAGLEAAQISAAIGGSVSAVQNIVAVFKDDKKIGDALKDVAKDTAVSAGVGYGTGFAGSALKGVMQNSKSQLMRNAASSNLPGVIVTSTIAFSQTIYQYFNGDIDGTQCLEQLGEQGTGMLSSAMFSAIGQTVIPIPVVGAMIGGMVGYALSSACYGNLMNALKEEKLAKEERILAEKMCEEHIRMIRAYRQELEAHINNYLETKAAIFNDAFNGIKDALQIGDIDGYITATNKITKALGKETLFENQKECDELMLSGMTIKI